MNGLTSNDRPLNAETLIAKARRAREREYEQVFAHLQAVLAQLKSCKP